MWRNKKSLIIAVVATTVLLAGTIGGVAYAQTASADTASGKTLLARVAVIMGVDQQKLEDAFAQAQREMREEALNTRLKGMVDEGKLTQEQADQYKGWLQSKPDVPLPGPAGRLGRGFGGRCFPLDRQAPAK